VASETQPSSSNAAPAEAGASHALARNQIVILGEGLPAAPRIIGQLTELLADPDTDMPAIASVLRTDPALTARAIRMSNAIMFGPVGTDVADIEEALTRVGVTNVLGLVGVAGITQWVAEPLALYGIDIDTFQRSSVCHAVTAEHLAQQLGEDFRAAYVVGLLRGLGMIVLDRAAGVITNCPVFNPAKHRSYDEFERQVFGTTSRDVTRLLMEEWNFPAPIIEALDLHLLDTADSLGNRLACIVNVAGEIAAAAGHGLPGDDVHWTAAPGKYETLGVTEDFWKELCAAAKGRSAGMCDTLSSE
jgi:HD-like signal output (HDOD) protein